MKFGSSRTIIPHATAHEKKNSCMNVAIKESQKYRKFSNVVIASIQIVTNFQRLEMKKARLHVPVL